MASQEPTLIDTGDNETAEGTPVAADPENGAVTETGGKPLQYIRVNPGDTLESIAAEYGTTTDEILKNNQVNPAALYVGHWLYV